MQNQLDTSPAAVWVDTACEMLSTGSKRSVVFDWLRY